MRSIQFLIADLLLTSSILRSRTSAKGGASDVTVVFKLIVDELALVAVRALTGRVLMPLFAHFGFVVFVHGDGLHDELMMTMRIAAFRLEFALARVHEVAT